MSEPAESVTKPRRGPITGIIIAAIVVACVVIMFLVAPRGDRVNLSPNSVLPNGTGALATILESEGVDVTYVSSWEEFLDAASPSATLVIPSGQTRHVGVDRMSELTRSSERIVIIGERWGYTEVSDWGLPGTIGAVKESRMEAGCSVDDAVSAGGIGPVTQVFQTPLDGCFANAAGAGWAQAETGPAEIIADATILTNEKLANPGNATFALRRLGSTDSVVWLAVNATEYAEQRAGQSSTNLTPSWWIPAGVALLLAFVWLVIYRGRRFGKLVAEPMPVAVPAHEADVGRARLYQRGRNVEHAAQALRAGAISRLGSKTGLRRNATRPQVVSSISAIAKKPAELVDDLFYARPITTETDLMTLATDLDEFVKEITNDRAS